MHSVGTSQGLHCRGKLHYMEQNLAPSFRTSGLLDELHVPLQERPVIAIT